MALNWCWSLSCFKNISVEQTDYDINEIDFSNCGLLEVPTHIFLYERTLEKLFLNSNRITELPRILCNCLALKVLNLSDNQLTILPDALNSLQSLEFLDISRNQISKLGVSLRDCRDLRVLNMGMNPISKLPDVVTQVSSLEELYLNDMDLGFLPANIGRMTQLKILEVRANRLSTLPASLGRLVHLQRLDIGQNEFEQLPPAVRQLPKLKELWCDFNPMTESDDLSSLECLTHIEAGDNMLTAVPPGIPFCVGLVHVTLTCNHITVIPHEIGKLKALVTLKLDINDLTCLPSTIGELTSLEELHLSENYIKTLPSSIGLLRNLVILHVDSNSLRKLPPEIGSCSRLRILSLQDNKLKQVPPEIGNLSNLRVLSLGRNSLDRLPLSVFKLKNLKSLWLSYNQGLPLTPLCKTYDGETHSHFATNYLLPQRKLDYDDKNALPEKEQQDRREKVQPFIKFSINVDLAERNSGFTRVPTPYPKRPKKQSKILKADANEKEVQVVSKKEDEHPVAAEQQVPSPTRSVVRTAVVRRQVADENVPSCSRTDSDECRSEEKSEEEASTFGVAEELARSSSYEVSASSSKEVADLFCTDEEDLDKMAFITLPQCSDSELSSTDCFRPISTVEQSGSLESLPHSVKEDNVEVETKVFSPVDTTDNGDLHRNIGIKYGDSNRNINANRIDTNRTATDYSDLNKTHVSQLSDSIRNISAKLVVNQCTDAQRTLSNKYNANRVVFKQYSSLNNIANEHCSDLGRTVNGNFVENNRSCTGTYSDLSKMVTDEYCDLNRTLSDKNDLEGKYWASVAFCTTKNTDKSIKHEETRPSSRSDECSRTWAFGVHRNVIVIEISVQKNTQSLGFTLNVNEAGFIVVDTVKSEVDISPDLRVGDKILQIGSIDVASSNLEYINSLLNNQRKSFTMMISRFA